MWVYVGVSVVVGVWADCDCRDCREWTRSGMGTARRADGLSSVDTNANERGTGNYVNLSLDSIPFPLYPFAPFPRLPRRPSSSSS